MARVLLLAFMLYSTQSSVYARNIDIQNAVDALTLHYIKNSIYRPVDCRYRDKGGVKYILCSATHGDGSIGGLYGVKVDEDHLKISPINGKAKQHIGTRSSINDAGGNAVPLSDWSDLSTDIPAVIGLFN